MANSIYTNSALFPGVGIVYLEDTPDAPTDFLYANVTMCGHKPEHFIQSENPLPIQNARITWLCGFYNLAPDK